MIYKNCYFKWRSFLYEMRPNKYDTIIFYIDGNVFDGQVSE